MGVLGDPTGTDYGGVTDVTEGFPVTVISELNREQ